MVYVPLKNGSGQVVKDIKLKSPEGTTYTVVSTSRKGINKYQINLVDAGGNRKSVMNYDIDTRGEDAEPWSVVGGFHSPTELAKIFGKKKVDPDANKPRSERESFWKQKNKPGTHSYEQKKRLMSTNPSKYKSFKEHWEEHRRWVQENFEEE